MKKIIAVLMLCVLIVFAFSGCNYDKTYVSIYFKDKMSNKYKALFASPEFSCDNAAGIAIYGYLKENQI